MNIYEMHTAFKLEIDKSGSLETAYFEPEEIDYWLNLATSQFVKTRYSGNNFKKEGFEQSQKRTDDLRTLVTISEITPTVLTEDYYNTAGALSGFKATLPANYWFTLSEECKCYYPRSSYAPSIFYSGVTEVTSDNYRDHIDNPYSMHILHYNDARPLRYYVNDSVVFVTDGTYGVARYYLKYIKSPDVVSLKKYIIPMSNNSVTFTSGSTGILYVSGGTVYLSGATYYAGSYISVTQSVQYTVTRDVDSEAEIYTTVNSNLPLHTHEEIVKIASNMAIENIESQRYQTHSIETASME